MKETKHIISTADTGGSIIGGLNEDTQEWTVKQDEQPFLEVAKDDREKAVHGGVGNGAWKKAFSIPDIVAIDILSKYGLDVHDPDFMRDPQKVKKLFQIVKSEYKYLMAY